MFKVSKNGKKYFLNRSTNIRVCKSGTKGFKNGNTINTCI